MQDSLKAQGTLRYSHISDSQPKTKYFPLSSSDHLPLPGGCLRGAPETELCSLRRLQAERLIRAPGLPPLRGKSLLLLLPRGSPPPLPASRTRPPLLRGLQPRLRPGEGVWLRGVLLTRRGGSGKARSGHKGCWSAQSEGGLC